MSKKLYYLRFILILIGFQSCNNEKHNSKEFNNDIPRKQIDEIDNYSQIVTTKMLKFSDYKDLKIEFNDTIHIGRNIGRIINYKPKRNDIDYLLSVIIENEYENGRIVKDTFSDGTLAPWFGVYANKKGVKNIKGVILEEALNDTNTFKDSILHIERTFIHFSISSYVLDSISN